jgi:hypothetical protein
MSDFVRNIVSARQLRAARVMAGLTQRQLSIEAGFNPRAAKYWARADEHSSNPRMQGVITSSPAISL